jgi:hypothetical protein
VRSRSFGSADLEHFKADLRGRVPRGTGNQFSPGLALFRWAVIFEGIAARARAGNASAENAAETGRLAAAFARRAADLV